MDIQHYLDRINIAHVEQPGLASLTRLQMQHLLSIPFENLSVVTRETIVLDEAWLYEKIVRQQRGGFCYELNGLFGCLLRELGFSIKMVSARVYEADTGRFGPEFDHMALLVELDQTYLVDVGFGDTFRQPIPLPDGTTEDVSGRYRVIPDQSQPGEYVLQRQEANARQPQYRFSRYPRQFSDYVPMCHYHQTSPESHFTQRTVCTIATPNGRKTLTADTLTITEANNKAKIPASSKRAFRRLLREHFGIGLE